MTLKCYETLILTDIFSSVMDIDPRCYFQVEFGSFFCTANCFSKSYPTKPKSQWVIFVKEMESKG